MNQKKAKKALVIIVLIGVLASTALPYLVSIR